ncbi:MAG: hypothetical protein ABWY68_00920, partial [Cryobacterium sp.]
MTYNDVRSETACPSGPATTARPRPRHPDGAPSRRRVRAAFAAVLAVALTAAGALAAAPASAVPATAALAPDAPLTNLSHLTFLLDTVPLPELAGHTTYQAAEQPTAEAPWTYADRNDDGSYSRIGGGTLDPATNEWSQGAYNADDIARTAVVYLRHWQQTGDATSREHAVQTLRSLTYLQ